MENALAGNRGMQATREGYKATRITAMLIQDDPGNLGVARVVGVGKKLGPQMYRSHVPCEDPSPRRCMSENKLFCPEHGIAGLLCTTRRQSS